MEGADPRTDGELLVATATDPDAFGTFFRRHVRGVLGFFRRRGASPEVALDLTAETFAAALEASPRYELRPEPARNWLYGIAWNKLHEAQRRGHAEDAARRALGMAPIVLSDEGIARIEALAGSPALELMESLPSQQRDAVRARVIDGREYDEIAEELRCSPSLVRKRVSRGWGRCDRNWRSCPTMRDDPISLLERELVEAAKRRVQPAGSATARGRRSSLGAFAAVVLSGVAVAVALGALVSLRGHQAALPASSSRPPAAVIPGRRQLIDVLGVLRRPQRRPT